MPIIPALKDRSRRFTHSSPVWAAHEKQKRKRRDGLREEEEEEREMAEVFFF